MCTCAGQRKHTASTDRLIAEVDETLRYLAPHPAVGGDWPRTAQLESAVVRAINAPPATAPCQCSSAQRQGALWIAEDEFPSHVNDALESSTVRLDLPVRRGFEHLLGSRFDDVRISVGEAARQSAEALGVSAYSVGKTIVFGRDVFDPDSVRGRWLLAHELVHVIQQSLGDAHAARDGAYLRRLERQAHRVSELLGAGRFERSRSAGAPNFRILPAPRVLQAVTVGPRGRACMGQGCPVAVPDLIGSGSPTGCVIADCDVPHGPSPKTIISFFCLYACASGRGAVMFRTTAGFMCGPISTII